MLVFLVAIGILELNSVKIIHNTSFDDGGGIFNYGNKHADLYRNVLIANNLASSYGGGIYNASNYYENPLIINATISNNKSG